MAMYKYRTDLENSTHDVFDKIYKPGDRTPYSGVYRCQSCAVEIVSEQANPFPPTRACREHNSKAVTGFITWRMVVYAQHAK